MAATERKPIVPVPRYYLVRDSIMLDLYQNSYREGTRYATEQELCERFQVGRNTVRHALCELEKRGFLTRKQRVGVIVCRSVAEGRREIAAERKVLLLLPWWSYIGGNFYERIVARRLSEADERYRPHDVEMRLYHAPIPDDPAQLLAVVAIDPVLQQLPVLAQLAAQGVRVITVEAQTNFYMAANIQLDLPSAMGAVMKKFYRAGHRQIGVVRQESHHFSHQHFGDCVIRALAEWRMKFDPRLFIFHRHFDECPDYLFRRVTAWLCNTWADFELIAGRLKKLGLRVPEDVSVIAGDDHGEDRIDSIGTSLSVFRPDYDGLAELLRQLLDSEWQISPGTVLHCPMSVVWRGSFAGCRR